MTKKHVLGSEPPVDPVEQMRQAMFSFTTDSSIKFKSRKVSASWTIPIAVSIVAFASVLSIPQIVIVFELVTILALLSLRVVHNALLFEQAGNWHKVELTIPSIRPATHGKHLRIDRDLSDNVTGMAISKVGRHLRGNLGSFVRGVYSEDGFCLGVTLELSDTGRILDGRILDSAITTYLRGSFGEDVESYMESHGYLWDVHTLVIGHIQDEYLVGNFINSVKGAIPVKKWSVLTQKVLSHTLKSLKVHDYPTAFYAVGRELSEWLIQMRSELTGEVGLHVPGQFYASIRANPDDIVLGTVLNPDTLRAGPPIGLTIENIANGVLLCGGSTPRRHDVLARLIQGLLSNGKRVLLLSAHADSQRLASLSSEGVAFTLGKDFVLNPVDNENVPRPKYVSHLLMSLEALTEKTMTHAADLENALYRAVALSNSTVADIKLEEEEPASVGTGLQQSQKYDNRHSLIGMEAIKRLRQGMGARAFYGAQTVPVSRLAAMPLSIVSITLGDDALELIGWDIFLAKLLGLAPSEDYVIVLDDPLSLRYTFRRFGRRETFVERLMKELTSRFTVILSIDRPSDLGTGVRNLLQSCISLRLKHDDDVASVTSTLSLNVVTTGLHSKARWSPRESAFLRTMEENMALIVRDAESTAQPVRLLEPPDIPTISEEDAAVRLQRLVPRTAGTDESPGTLIERVGGSDSDLAVEILKLLERYEPLTEQAVRKFIQAKTISSEDIDVEGIIIRLKKAGMILEGHETHGGVAYKNYRLTMKGSLALRQVEGVSA